MNTGNWSLDIGPRHCLVCLREIPGTRSLYCDEDRLRVRRAQWRESKRRSVARMKVAALAELRRAAIAS